MNEMESCPFCGNTFYKGYKKHLTASYLPQSGDYGCSIMCNSCNTIVFGHGHTEEEAIEDAIKRWNTRHKRVYNVERIKSGVLYDVYHYTCCGYEHSESTTDAGASEIPLNFCPNCGEKVTF